MLRNKVMEENENLSFSMDFISAIFLIFWQLEAPMASINVCRNGQLVGGWRGMLV